MNTPVKITVIPEAGRLVMNPATGQPLPSADARPQGTRVPRTSYWHKRVASGDVREIAAPAPSAEADQPAPEEAAPVNVTTEAPASKPSKPKDK